MCAYVDNWVKWRKEMLHKGSHVERQIKTIIRL